MKYTVAALAAVLALGTTSASWAAVANASSAQSSGFEQVDSFHHFGRFDNWRVVDRDTLIVWTTPSRPYLIELMRPSPDLRYAEIIGVTSTIGKTYASFDSVIVRGWHYPIKAIYKMSPEEARGYTAKDTGTI